MAAHGILPDRVGAAPEMTPPSRGDLVRGTISFPIAVTLPLAILAGILAVMYMTPGLRLSVYLIPVWLAALAIGYRFRGKNAGYAARDRASAG